MLLPDPCLSQRVLLCCCSDHANLLKETLEKQFEVVKERVSRNGTYMQGSHVLQFGSLSIDEEPASDYLGEENTGKPQQPQCVLTQRLTQRLTQIQTQILTQMLMQRLTQMLAASHAHTQGPFSHMCQHTG